MATKSHNEIVRPPVVAVMGHIDHGKSTLLDYIRKSNTTNAEVGGITQTISAYEISRKNAEGVDSTITFLDTPGHAAFVSLRDRGALIADIAILVVSAEDGVKPQTVEALRSIKDAGVPYIVAINKIDKENANIEKTKQNLSENEIYIEGYGGDTPAVAISAKTGKGIDDLLDMITLVSDLQELKGDALCPASGIVLEAGRSKEKGVAATLVIKNGTLKNGTYIAAGESLSPVRFIEDFTGKKIDEATFSSPVRVIGFDSIPIAGTTFQTFASKKEAETYVTEIKTAKNNAPKDAAVAADETKYVIPIILKANSAGGLEALQHETETFSHERIVYKVISKSIGDISENDVKVASGKPETLLVGFSTKVDAPAKQMAERLGIDIKVFDIIYKFSEWLEEISKVRAPKIEVEEKTGSAKILKLFSHVKDRQIIGGRVEEGVIKLGEEVKLFRRDTEIGRGKIKELQTQKTKAAEVKEGTEFGAMIESKIELAPGDKIECFTLTSK